MRQKSGWLLVRTHPWVNALSEWGGKNPCVIRITETACTSLGHHFSSLVLQQDQAQGAMSWCLGLALARGGDPLQRPPGQGA